MPDNLFSKRAGLKGYQGQPLSSYGQHMQDEFLKGKTFYERVKKPCLEAGANGLTLGGYGLAKGAYQTYQTRDWDYLLESSINTWVMSAGARRSGCDIPLNRKTAGRCRDFLSRLHNDEHGAIQIPLTRRGRRGGTGNAVHASENQRGFTVQEASGTVYYVVDPDGRVLPFQFDKDSARIWCEKSNAPRGSMPDWLRERLEAGNEFNRTNRSRYPYNEVEVDVGEPKNFVVDSYNPIAREIVSRKFTQLADVKESTAIGYLQEFVRKYPEGATITNSPFNPKVLCGQRLQGDLILEVPVQNNPVPQAILDAALERGIIIRDPLGTIY